MRRLVFGDVKELTGRLNEYRSLSNKLEYMQQKGRINKKVCEIVEQDKKVMYIMLRKKTRSLRRKIGTS